MILASVEGLSLSRGGRRVLEDVSLRIAAGEIVTLVGPNGSGKTSLLRALMGMVAPDAGRVTRAPGLRIGYVPQRLAVDRGLPITALRFLSLPRRVPRVEAMAALARTGVADCADRPLAGLSGGQLQRVLLARALLGGPQLLVLDEPTQGLDQPGEAAFYRLLAGIRQETGAGVLLVSHDLHVVMAASDRVVCLNGHVCCEGTPQVVSAAPEYRALFGLGTGGALALYRHDHDHAHDHGEGNARDLGHAHDHGEGFGRAPGDGHMAHDRTRRDQPGHVLTQARAAAGQDGGGVHRRHA